MKSACNQFYDADKDRRYGNLFFATLMAIFLVLGIVAFIRNEFAGSGDSLGQAALFILLCGAALLISADIRRFGKTSKTPFQVQPMSRDEIIKARTKLVRNNPSAFRR